MKRLTLAIGLLAMLAGALPLSAGTARAGGVVTVAHRRPYRHSHWHGGGYWGSGWGWGGRWGFGYGPYSYDPWYGPYYGRYGRPYGYGPSARWAAVDTDVSPESARVYLDGKYVGLADDFDGYPDYLYLRRGRYRLEFRLDGFQSREIEVDARPGVKIDVGEKLAKIPGAARYGSYEEPEPEGGVRRFWAKRRDVAESITDEEEIYGDRRPRERAERPRGTERGDDEEQDEVEAERDRDRGAVERDRENRDDWRDRDGERRGVTRLSLEVEPSDAAIYLDDRFLGTAGEFGSGRSIAVTPGRHTVVISRPGYQDRRLDIDVASGKTEKVEISLKR